MRRALSPAILALTATCPVLFGGAAGPEDERARAAEAVARGDFREAREILAGLIRDENVERALELMDGGRALDSLELLDEAVDLFPRDAQLLHLRGRAAYVAASEPGASNPGFFYEDALTHFEAAIRRGYGVEALFDASRAARRVPRPVQALELARKGREILDRMETPPTLDPSPNRVLAEASFDVFRERFTAGEEFEPIFVETERLLGVVLGEAPDDTWSRRQLSNLYEWKNDFTSASLQIRAALELEPMDAGLHSRLHYLAPAGMGTEALVAYYRGFSDLHPESATVWRNRGVAEFHAALAGLESGKGDASAFSAAEEHFSRARTLDPAWTMDCMAYEVICRNGVGWCHFNAGEMSAAKDAFLAMEELFEGGLQWSLGARLPDGVAGLRMVVGVLIDDPLSLSSLGDMVQASTIADFLEVYLPEDGNAANDAAFVARDTAVLFERSARQIRSAALAEEDPSKQAELEREAERQLARAQELMERSFESYEEASSILTEDVRVINDTGLVMAYYLRTDPELAERYFLRAVELGTAQLAADDELPEGHPRKLEELERYRLNEAWGDAHQNLALLELTIRRRGEEAATWLEKSLEIGPPSRDPLRVILDVCKAMAEGEDVDLSRAAGGLVNGLVWLHNPRR